MSVLDKSGLQRLWSKIKSNLAAKDEIADFVTSEDVEFKIANAGTQVAVGKFTLEQTGVSGTSIDFDFVPAVIKIWTTDSNNSGSMPRGSLVGLLHYSGLGSDLNSIVSYGVDGDMSTPTSFTPRGYSGNYAYEAYR